MTSETDKFGTAALENSLDTLNIALRNVEVALRSHVLKTHASVPIPLMEGEAQQYLLLWAPHEKNGWSLHVCTKPGAHVFEIHPLRNAPWHLRVRATACFDALVAQAELELQQRNQNVQEAIQRCDDFVRKMGAKP